MFKKIRQIYTELNSAYHMITSTMFEQTSFSTKEDVEQWLKGQGIANYRIDDNLIVDVDGEVCFYKDFDQLPIQFGVVTGDFLCNGIGLTTLKGSPHKVGGNFEVSSCNLKDLQFCPSEVGGNVWLVENPLTTLKYCPKIVKGDFDCGSNETLDLTNFNSFNCDIGQFRHHTSQENNKIEIFSDLYQEGHYDPYSKRGLYYYLQLDGLEFKSILSKAQLNENLCTVL